MLDKEDIEEVEFRWKILALFSNGHVMEIVPQKPTG